MYQISHVMGVRHSNNAAETLEKFQLLEYLPHPYQLFILNQVFGESIQRNAFFRGTDIYFIVELLKDISTLKVSAGEYIYNSNMPADKGKIISLVFLIVEGMVNCIYKRDACFKTYSKGSYFGDLEVFNNCPRYFGVKASRPTTLMILTKERIEQVFKVYREYKFKILRRSIGRLIKCNISLSRINHFDKLMETDKFWKRREETGQGELHEHLNRFLEDMVKIKEDISDE